MGVIKNKNITYLSVEDLPIWNYTKIVEGDYRWMLRIFTGYEEVVIPNNAPEIFDSIQEDYYKLVKTHRSQDYFELLVEISDLKARHDAVIALAKSLELTEDDEVRSMIYDEISNNRIAIRRNLDHSSQIDSILAQLRGLKTKIGKKELDLEKYKKEDGDEQSIFKQKINLEKILEVKINLKETVLKEWAELIKMASDK